MPCPTDDPTHNSINSSPSINETDLTFHNTPNYLTLVRILLVPAVIYFLFQKTYWNDFWAALIFGIAAITDYFDGYLARKHKIETVYGKLMDPLADKFLVICSLIMLQELGRINPLVVMLLVCRELTITGLRALASAEGVIMAASAGGKWKTAFQMGAIPALMVRELFTINVYDAGLVALYLSLALSLGSAKDYVFEFFKGLRLAKTQRAKRKQLKKNQSINQE